MKTKINKRELSEFLKGLMFGFIIIAVMVAVTGCSKKDDGANQDPYGWRGRGIGGRGYGGNGRVHTVAMGFDTYDRGSVILAIASDNDVSYGSQEAWVEGEIELFEPMDCLYGGGYGGYINGLNRGVYELIPYDPNTPAYYNINFLTNAYFYARGRGGDAVITIPYASVFSSNVCGYQGLAGAVNFVEVNGEACGQSWFVNDQNVGGMCY